MNKDGIFKARGSVLIFFVMSLTDQPQQMYQRFLSSKGRPIDERRSDLLVFRGEEECLKALARARGIHNQN